MEEGLRGPGRLEARGRRTRYVAEGRAGVRVPTNHCQNPTVINTAIINQGKRLHFSLALEAFKSLPSTHSDQKMWELEKGREDGGESERGSAKWCWVDRCKKKAREDDTMMNKYGNK